MAIRVEFSAAVRPAAGAALGLILLSASALPYNYQVPKQDYAGALEALDAARTPSDGVVTAGWGAWPYQRYFERAFPRISGIKYLSRSLRQSVTEVALA